MQDIINNYNVELEKYKNKHAELEAEKERIESRIERANKQLAKLEEKDRKLHRPSRYDVIEALAVKLSEHYGLPYEIYGPFGVECETSIYLRKDMTKSITAQKTISIRLRPFGDRENDWMTYDTGKRTNEFPIGSIGELNGYNSVYAPLPKDFNEILKLMTGDDKTPNKMSFIDDLKDGKTTFSDIDKYVEFWHTHDTGDTLQKFLGLTDEQMEEWGKSSNASLEKTINKAKHICVATNKGEVDKSDIDLEI